MQTRAKRARYNGRSAAQLGVFHVPVLERLLAYGDYYDMCVLRTICKQMKRDVDDIARPLFRFEHSVGGHAARRYDRLYVYYADANIMYAVFAEHAFFQVWNYPSLREVRIALGSTLFEKDSKQRAGIIAYDAKDTFERLLRRMISAAKFDEWRDFYEYCAARRGLV